MTTKITVDAHAGWPVEVRAVDGPPEAPATHVLEVVAPGQVREFYAWSGRSLVVTEMARPAEVPG